MMTPGPWRINDKINYVDGCNMIENDDGVICHVETWFHEDDETIKEAEANAQAIAAVPELIEALKDLADDKGSAIFTAEEVRQIARLALVKAGVSP